jgi:hypothetical protein
MKTTIAELYGVEVDSYDWPIGMPDHQKVLLCEALRKVFRRSPKGVEMWLLEEQSEVRDALRGATVVAWRRAAVTRACRALGAVQGWTLPEAEV